MARFSSALLLVIASLTPLQAQAQEMGFFERFIANIVGNRVARACDAAIERITFEDIKFEDYFDCSCNGYFSFGDGFGATVDCALKQRVCLPNVDGTDSTNCGDTTLSGLYGARLGASTTMCLEFKSEGTIGSIYDDSSLCVTLVNDDLPNVQNIKGCEVAITRSGNEEICNECTICDADGNSPAASGQDLTFDCSNIKLGQTDVGYPSIKPQCIGATTIKNLANATQNLPFSA